MTNLTDLSLADAVKGLENKEFSAVDIAKEHLNAIDALNPSLNAYTTVTHDIALKQAEESDKRRASGKAGLLEGERKRTAHEAAADQAQLFEHRGRPVQSCTG